MPAPGELADVLRALGRYLDDLRPTAVSIENHGSYLRVSWQSLIGEPGLRYVNDFSPESLLAQARAMRQGQRTEPGASLAETLRVLGQELERAQVDVATIVEEHGAYRVSGRAEGRDFWEVYSPDRLAAMSLARRAQRATPGG